MASVVIVVGALAVAAAWRAVARGVSVWTAMGIVLALAGAAALATGWVDLSPRVAPVVAAGVGLGSGIVLWAATRAFVAVAGRWPPFRRHVADIYAPRGELPLGAALALAVLLVAPGEELFWRGLVQHRLAAATDAPVLGAALAWATYVAANLASASLPIVAAAVVGGTVWAGLALWTRGVLASAACHMAWTALMLLLPPKEAAS